MFTRLQTIFVHDPVRLPSIWRATLIEHQCLPHPYNFRFGKHSLVPPRRLPEPGTGCPISPSAARVLLVFMAEEVPLTLLLISKLASL